MNEEGIRKRIEQLLFEGQEPVIFVDFGKRQSLRVRPVKISAPHRPDGLKTDAPKDVGFTFEAAEAHIEIEASALSRPQLESVHRILWEAGTDDWMDYSHFGAVEAHQLNPDDILALRFSSAYKGARIINELLAVLNQD